MDPGRGESLEVRLLLLDHELLDGESPQRLDHRRQICAGVDEGSQGHISGYPGEAIEVRETH
jgi:hypothetical protein